MKTRFIAYNRLGAKRGVLPQVLSAEIVPSKNELPTLRLHYPRNVPQHAYLLNDPEIAFEYYNEATKEWVEPYDARFRPVGTDFDYLEEVATRTYTLIGIGEVLKGIYLFEARGLETNEEGKVQFPASNAGKMLGHVWNGAVARGFKGFTRTFTDTHDSAGQPWGTTLSITFSTDTSFEAMLQYLNRLGLIDFNLQGRVVNVYNADQAMARDLTLGNTPLRFNLSGGPASVDSAPELQSREDLATHVVVTGEEGLRWVFPTGITLPEGRREVFLSYSGVDDEGTARILAAPTITKYSNTLTNTTRQFRLHKGTKILPYRDYRVGDWALVEKDNATWERKQIFQLSLLIDSSGVQGYVSLGDKIDSLLERLNERVQRIQGGTASEGTERPEPSQAKPSAPTGLVVTSTVMPDAFGQYQALIALNFTHNGKTTTGANTTLSQFQVRYRRTGETGWRNLFQIPSPSQSGTYSWLPAKNADGSAASYQFHVVAINTRGVASNASATATHEIRQDSEAPLKPSTPTVGASNGVFTVTVDHKQSNGEAHVADYLHAVVQMASSPSGPWSNVDTIVPPNKKAYIPAGGYFTRHFRVIAVDYQGNQSPASDAASATTTKFVDSDIILSEIDAGRTIIRNAGEVLLDATTKLTTRLSNADTAISNAQSSIANLTTRVNPLETQIVSWRDTTIPNIVSSINGKNKINRATTDAATPANFVLGDRWERWSTLAAGGKLLKTWRHNGTAWIQESIDETYLPAVDIGTGTYGNLAGGRITANSIGVNQLMVGGWDNLIENGNLTYGTHNWYQTPAGWTVIEGGGRNGLNSWQFTGSTTRSLGPVSQALIEYNPNDSYRLSAWVKPEGLGAATRGELSVYWYAKDGTFVSNRNFYINMADMVDGTYKYFSFVTQLPDTAVYMRYRISAMLQDASHKLHFADMQLTQATNGSLVVNGSINGDHVDANSVASKIGSFLKLYSNQVIIGQPNNVLPDPNFSDAGQMARINQASTATVTLSVDGDHAVKAPVDGTNYYYRPLGVPQTVAAAPQWVNVQPGEVWEWGITISQMKGTGNWIQFVGRTIDGSAYKNPSGRTTLPAGNGTYKVRVTIPADCYWIMPEMQVNEGTQWVKRGSMYMKQIIDESLIVDGGIVARHITASEELSAKVASFLQIYARQVYIGNGLNLVPDPTFTQPNRIMSIGNNGVGWTTYKSGSGSGSQAIQYLPRLAEGTQSPDGFLYPLGFNNSGSASKENWLPCTGGQKYEFKYRAYFGGNVAPVQFRCYANVLLEDGTIASAGSQPWQTTGGNKSFEFVIPETGKAWGVTIQVKLPPENTAWWSIYGQNLGLYLKMDNTLVVDGAITTNKLTVTQDMVAEFFRVKKIEAGDINFNNLFGDTGFIGNLRTTVLTANSVTTEQLKADAITSKHTLTGPVIQTHAAALTGVKINSGGIYAYDGNQAQTFRLNASNGRVEATGVFKAVGSNGASITMTNSGYNNRSQIEFNSGQTGMQASIWGSTGAAGDSAAGALYFNSYAPTNQDTYSTLILRRGGNAFLGGVGGGQQQDGIAVTSLGLTFTGRLAYNGSASFNNTFQAGITSGANCPANGWLEWNIAARYPTNNGKRYVSLTPHTTGKFTTAVQEVTGTGFKGRAYNMTTSVDWVHLEYNTTWGA